MSWAGKEEEFADCASYEGGDELAEDDGAGLGRGSEREGIEEDNGCAQLRTRDDRDGNQGGVSGRGARGGKGREVRGSN